ncbi:MAG: NAD-dependent epimerase/dehydratase family protein [Atopobiaceae bacterium]|jgi:UDP-glucuronate decarboxylase|nr:NAD-dependent epimerase/dehydratase family protein [Atopobiaceae bacterium]
MGIREQDLQNIVDGLSTAEKDKLNGSTVLITGCGGFLGYYFMNLLAEKGEDLGVKKVIGLDNFMLGKPKWIERIEKSPIVEIDKFDIIHDKLSDIQGASAADLIIHMASIASPMFYRTYPIETLDANIWGLRALLDTYVKKPIKGLLFFSSSETYGDPDAEHVPTNEEYRGSVSFTGPRACYDESKRFGETMCMLYAKQYDMPIGVARPFNNYGPGMRINDKRVVADFANDVVNGKDIVILSNGTPTRTFCYIADAITGYLKVLLHGTYDYFNIGIDKPEISMVELANIYAEAGKQLFGYQGEVKFATSEDPAYLTNNPQRRCPDITKARTVLGYDPKVHVNEGVGRFLQFIKENDEGEYLW